MFNLKRYVRLFIYILFVFDYDIKNLTKHLFCVMQTCTGDRHLRKIKVLKVLGAFLTMKSQCFKNNYNLMIFLNNEICANIILNVEIKICIYEIKRHQL